MKLEKNMYVRTLDGINKAVEVINNGVIDRFVNADGNIYYFCDMVCNPSHNILELIEPMDLMFIDISPDDCGGIVVPRIAETLDELEKWKDHISNGCCVLKGIITREQIESNIYKVSE